MNRQWWITFVCCALIADLPSVMAWLPTASPLLAGLHAYCMGIFWMPLFGVLGYPILEKLFSRQ